jgi:hypothetical protein
MIGMVLGVSEFEFGFSSHLCQVASRCGSIGAESSLFCLFYFILFYFAVLRNCQRCCRTLRLTVQKHHSIRNKELFYSLLGILSLLTNILDVIKHFDPYWEPVKGIILWKRAHVIPWKLGRSLKGSDPMAESQCTISLL